MPHTRKESRAYLLSSSRPLVALLGLAFCHAAVAQEQPVPQPAPPAATRPAAQDRAAITAASAAERYRELKLLGITAMQPPATAYDVGKPGNANYDESKANPYPNLPPLLVMKDGTKVKTAAQWQKRRAEIKGMFAEDVYGKYPAHLPSVTWRVESTEHMDVAGVPSIVKHIVGHTDNSAYPELTVDIHADVVTPASAAGKRVPIIIGGGSLRTATFRMPPPRAGAQPVHMLAMPENPPDSSKLLLEKGWGFVSRNLNEVQADNGAGLNKGIIGLVNHGQPRSLDDWGVLRAWAWADSRILDYLLTDHDVDAAKIGVTGHSRGGKEALLALADDTRFAIGYISSSGAGGADLYRRNYGETMGNLCGTSEFHWFAGNFMRYGAQGHTANELPVDSHELIALVAPRAIFIGGGALITDPKYAPGDAWQDAQGMFIAAAAASPAWQLLGAKGLGTTTFPPMNTLIDTGDVAFRQHQWGHTPAPNWPYFIEFAAKEFAKK